MTVPWHKGRVVLIGDAVHATTPHLGQGAGMAIEDSIVLAEEIARQDTPEAAFTAYHARRFERCQYIVESSLAICRSQLGTGPQVDQAAATKAMFDASRSRSEYPTNQQCRIRTDEQSHRNPLRRLWRPGPGGRARASTSTSGGSSRCRATMAWSGCRRRGHDEHHVVRLRDCRREPHRRDRARGGQPRRCRCARGEGACCRVRSSSTSRAR